MTLYFQGSELEALTPDTATGTYGANSSAGWVETDYARANSTISSLNTGSLVADAGQALADFYMWWWWKLGGGGNNVSAGWDLMTWYDDSDTAVVRCYWSATNTMVIQNKVGAAWVTLGAATMAVAAQTQDQFSIHIDVAGGHVKFWKTNALVVDEAADLSIVSGGIKYAKLIGYSRGHGISEVMIADEPLITWHCETLFPTGDGADTDGVGTYAAVDELGLDDTDGIVLSGGDRQSFTHGAPGLTGYIRAFTVAGRFSRTDAGSPSQVKAYVVRGGTRYYSSTFTLEIGYTNVQHSWNVDPSTNALWDLSVVNAGVEYGWEVV